MKVVVDTNVAVVTNGGSQQATPACVAACNQRLARVRKEGIVLDESWHILREYMRNLRSDGEPGVGDEFLKWVLTIKADPRFCAWVHINPQNGSYAEFPSDPELASFDPSDRKFVAVALAHPDRPPILNATDSDWWHHRDALARHGVTVDFICPDMPFSET